MPAVWNLSGPYALPGQVFVAAMTTAITFSAGPAIAYSGLAVQNPAGSGRKLIPIRAVLVPTGTGSVSSAPWGLMKLFGTAAVGTLSTVPLSGVTCAGAVGAAGTGGTAITGVLGTAVTGTTVALVGGTFSALNGTAGPTLNGLGWVEFLGGTPQGTATNGAGAPNHIQDLSGELTVLPGETVCLGVTAAIAGVGSIAWAEVPL